MQEGIEQGIERERHTQIEHMLQNGKSPEEISDFCGYTMEEILAVQNEILVTI